MKLHPGVFLLSLLASSAGAANVDWGVGPSSCTVSSPEDAGDRSLRDLLAESAAGTACRYNVTFRERLRLTPALPYEVKGTDFLLTGADLTSSAALPLGVVIDGRGLNDACVFRVDSTNSISIQALTIYVKSDRSKAVCDTAGNSLLDKETVSYPRITVCRGEGGTDCDWSPQLTDADGDGLSDALDRCDGRDADLREIMERNECVASPPAALNLRKTGVAGGAYEPDVNSFEQAESQDAQDPEDPPSTPQTPVSVQCQQGSNYDLSAPVGNACDDDWDNDGRKNWEDECPLDARENCGEEGEDNVPPPLSDTTDDPNPAGDGAVTAAGGCSLIF